MITRPPATRDGSPRPPSARLPELCGEEWQQIIMASSRRLVAVAAATTSEDRRARAPLAGSAVVRKIILTPPPNLASAKVLVDPCRSELET